MAGDTVQEILQAIARIDTKLDNVFTVQSDHEDRLRCIEKKGGQMWEKVILIAITAVISGLIGHYVK
jgi:hypothetical protein